ncbi:unnamed protein product [Lota lota]
MITSSLEGLDPFTPPQIHLHYLDVTAALRKAGVFSKKIHQARKLVCKKCKCPVTEEGSHVVCEGTRRYRICTTCIQEEAGFESLPMDATLEGLDQEPALLLGVDGEEEGDTQRTCAVAGPDRRAEIRKAVPTLGPLLTETQPAQVLRRQADRATDPCGQADTNTEPHLSHGTSLGVEGEIPWFCD